MTDTEKLEQLVTDVLKVSPTFTDEMMEKVRSELLKVGKEAEEFYKKKAEAM
ncbi:MAG: hypothetical protein J6X18_12475 [Bacteroidales bacterium]|nr:hypothetical protein [Bacteroidales bacterium]